MWLNYCIKYLNKDPTNPENVHCFFFQLYDTKHKVGVEYSSSYSYENSCCHNFKCT